MPARSDYSALFDSGDGTDIALCCGPREFKAHRTILRARSPYFKGLFESKMGEADRCVAYTRPILRFSSHICPSILLFNSRSFPSCSPPLSCLGRNADEVSHGSRAMTSCWLVGAAALAVQFLANV